MRYILAEHIALRSFMKVPYAWYRWGDPIPHGIARTSYELLARCDGQQEVEDSALLQMFAGSGFVRPVEEGREETLSSWQRPMTCQNRCFPKANWMITSRCNCNCLHCFNAADMNVLRDEWTEEEAGKLLDEAKRCGIHAWTITGGEPMLNPHFLDFCEGIYARDMFIEEINTNGAFITDRLLDTLAGMADAAGRAHGLSPEVFRMEETTPAIVRGCRVRPLLKLSFDGAGCHDWLRNQKGSEKAVLEAIRLCVAHGFPVMIQANVHRRNVHTLMETAERMEALGAERVRFIRTSESPRWKEMAGDACLTPEEYFDVMLAFMHQYAAGTHHMTVDSWEFMTIFPERHAYSLRPVRNLPGQYRPTTCLCRDARSMTAIAANGNLYPCHQISGTYDSRGVVLGNAKRQSLQELLREGPYLEEVCTGVSQIEETDPDCGRCTYFRQCLGGCRAGAVALSGSILKKCPVSCAFFKKGYPEKIAAALPGWENLTPLEEGCGAGGKAGEDPAGREAS